MASVIEANGRAIAPCDLLKRKLLGRLCEAILQLQLSLDPVQTSQLIGKGKSARLIQHLFRKRKKKKKKKSYKDTVTFGLLLVFI